MMKKIAVYMFFVLSGLVISVVASCSEVGFPSDLAGIWDAVRSYPFANLTLFVASLLFASGYIKGTKAYIYWWPGIAAVWIIIYGFLVLYENMKDINSGVLKQNTEHSVSKNSSEILKTPKTDIYVDKDNHKLIHSYIIKHGKRLKNQKSEYYYMYSFFDSKSVSSELITLEATNKDTLPGIDIDSWDPSLGNDSIFCYSIADDYVWMHLTAKKDNPAVMSNIKRIYNELVSLSKK